MLGSRFSALGLRHHPGRLWALSLAVVACLMGARALAQAPAQAPALDLPVRCTPGEDCWLVNLVDHDTTKGMRDFRCGRHGYDGHKGTDIAVRDLGVMRQGVAVVAAAPGTVKAIRDGMADKLPSADFRRNARNLYCGNGVVVSHGGGWETQYCHLRRNSVSVAKGQRIARGDRLGFVGQSGMAVFPHVHLSVRHRGRVIDPFVGLSRDKACGEGSAPLWTASAGRALSPPLTAIYNAGFAPTRPKVKAIRNGHYRDPALSRRAPALLLWAEIFWVRPGDRVTLRIIGPDGAEVAAHSNTLPKHQARRMIFAGRKKPGLFWPAGTYRGEVTVARTVAGKVRRFRARREVELKD